MSLVKLCSLTMALSENMVKNKDFILTLDLSKKWDERTLTALLISASCAKNFGDRNSLTLCLFTESSWTDKHVFDFGKTYPLPQHTNLKQQKSKPLQKKKKTIWLLSRLINSFPCASCGFKVKQELTHTFGNVNISAIAVQLPAAIECCTVS